MLKINNSNEIQTQMTRIIFNKKGHVLSLELWLNQNQYKFRDFTETRSLNALLPYFSSKVQDKKDYKDFDYESIKLLLSFLDDDQKEYKDDIEEKLKNHLIDRNYGKTGDLLVEITQMIEKQEIIKAYLDENKEHIKRKFLKEDLEQSLNKKDETIKTKKVKI